MILLVAIMNQNVLLYCVCECTGALEFHLEAGHLIHWPSSLEALNVSISAPIPFGIYGILECHCQLGSVIIGIDDIRLIICQQTSYRHPPA